MNIGSPTTDNAPHEADQHRGRNLTVARIVTAATALADDDGLDAVSMRKVAHHLGVGTMSLYTYLPSRADLVDLMVDTICGQIAAGGHRRHHGWRRRLADCARDDLAAHLRHPWLATVHTQASQRGPGSTAKYDRELASIDGIGLSDAEMATVVSLVTAHVQASARRHLTGTACDLPRQATDAQRTPTAHRVTTTDIGDGFEFGLDRILDGVATVIRMR